MWLGINTSLWDIAGVPLEKSLEEISRMGFTYMDIAAFGSANPCDMSQQQRQRIVATRRRLGLQCVQMVMLPSENIASPVENERRECLRYLKECARFQAELGGKQVLLGCGGGYHTLSLGRERAWVYTAECLREFCRWLKQLDMCLCLELEPTVYYMINSTDTMMQMIEDVDMDNLFANIDIGHLAISREAPVKLDKLMNKIVHVHISDNDGLTHSNSIIGSGVCPVVAYIDRITGMAIDNLCSERGQTLVAALELGNPEKGEVRPEHYVEESLLFLNKYAPSLRMDPSQ